VFYNYTLIIPPRCTICKTKALWTNIYRLLELKTHSTTCLTFEHNSFTTLRVRKTKRKSTKLNPKQNRYVYVLNVTVGEWRNE